ncbi:MAG: DUF2459 domain-containing protein [Bdellovibrionales bacterium]|nr:DUF2459 domain-containing protein [Bdellovibrionales bacterium]
MKLFNDIYVLFSYGFCIMYRIEKIFMKISMYCKENLLVFKAGEQFILKCLVFMFFLTCACKSVLPVEEGPRPHLVYVVSNGWHTAIVVSAPALVATGVLPEAADFPDALFLEFGWGDRNYYQAEETTFSMTLMAALVPTPAVMHIAALQAPPEENNSLELEVVSMKLTEEGFFRLFQALAAGFDRPSGGRTKSISPGLYTNSYFYHARGEFHLFNTCNTWTARMLSVSGVALSPSGIVTADGLMDRLREVLNME